MKPIHNITLLVFFLLPTSALVAQPPSQAQATANIEARPPAPMAPEKLEQLQRERENLWLDTASALSPEQVLQNFNQDFNVGFYQGAALLVAGAPWNSDEPNELLKVRINIRKTTRWQIRFDGPADITGDEATVSPIVGVTDQLALTLTHQGKVELRRDSIRGRRIWRIIPPDPEEVFGPERPSAENLPLQRMAAYVASPVRARKWLIEHIASQRLWDLGLALMQYTQDYDEKLPAAAEWKQNLSLYLRDPEILTSPLDTVPTQSFAFNTALSEVQLRNIKSPPEVVAFYDGSNGALNFRYDGKALVCYADGHVKFVDAETAKTLRWNP